MLPLTSSSSSSSSSSSTLFPSVISVINDEYLDDREDYEIVELPKLLSEITSTEEGNSYRVYSQISSESHSFSTSDSISTSSPSYSYPSAYPSYPSIQLPSTSTSSPSYSYPSAYPSYPSIQLPSTSTSSPSYSYPSAYPSHPSIQLPSTSYSYYQAPPSSSSDSTSTPSPSYSYPSAHPLYPSIQLPSAPHSYQAPSFSSLAPAFDNSYGRPPSFAPIASPSSYLPEYLPTKPIPPYRAPEEIRENEGGLKKGVRYLGSFFSRSAYASSLETFCKAIGTEKSHQSTIENFVADVSKIVGREASVQEKIKGFNEAIGIALPLLPKKGKSFVHSLENQLRLAFYNQIIQEESEFLRNIFWQFNDENPHKIIDPILQAKRELTDLRLGQKDGMREGIGCNPEKDIYAQIFSEDNTALIMMLKPPMRALQEAYAKLQDAGDECPKEMLTTYQLRWQCWARALEVLSFFSIETGFSQGEPIPFEKAFSKPSTNEGQPKEIYRETKERHKSNKISDTRLLLDPSIPSSRKPIRKRVEVASLDLDRANHEHYIDVMFKVRPVLMEGDWFKQLPAGTRYRIYKLYLERSPNKWVNEYEAYRSKYTKNCNAYIEMSLIRKRFITPMIEKYPREMMEPLMSVIYSIEARGDLQTTYSLVRSIPRPFFKGKDFVTYIEYLKNQFQIENTETDKGSKKLSNKEKNILIQGVLWWFDDQISKFEREIAKNQC